MEKELLTIELEFHHHFQIQKHLYKVPRENAMEAAVVEGIEVLAVESLTEVAASLNGEQEIFSVQREVEMNISAEPYADDFA